MSATAPRRALVRRAVLRTDSVAAGSCIASPRFRLVGDDPNRLLVRDATSGLEGVVAKKRNGIYRPGYRGWTKIKNPTYWRRESEIEHVQRTRNRTAVTV